VTTLSSPADIFEHTMDVIAGFDMAPGAMLNFTADLSANVSLIPYEGRIVHLNGDGDWEMGAVAKKMPCVIMKPSVPYGGQPTVSPYWRAIGKFPLAALPCVGGFEIATTEYDTAQTYVNGDFLTAKADNTAQATGGVLTNVVPGTATPLTAPWVAAGTTRTLCGQVTRAPETLKNKNTVLSFWTLFFPGTTG
jgi:hypothetical protein